MDPRFYQRLAEDALADRSPEPQTLRRLIDDEAVELLPLLHAAYTARRHHFGRRVQVHILNNAQNGHCPEDCAYCTQARTSEAQIEAYGVKREAEILSEAERAYRAGAYRYCMVFAGRGPGERRVAWLADVVRKIKARWPLEVCVSAGLLDEAKAAVLAEAGVDRLNHNLNTSRRHYPSICTTHTYDDRLATLRAARQAGLQTCSGLIAGMGEATDDLIEVAQTLRELGSESIPVNFLLPFEGTAIGRPRGLTPQRCLRVLCLFRLTNPRAEVRCAAGREFHLGALEPLCLYPANSLFVDGYLNAAGAERRRTYRMIRDAGFEVDSNVPLDELLDEASQATDETGDEVGVGAASITVGGQTPRTKTVAELRPACG